jgi:hypothetical protein
MHRCMYVAVSGHMQGWNARSRRSGEFCLRRRPGRKLRAQGVVAFREMLDVATTRMTLRPVDI